MKISFREIAFDEAFLTTKLDDEDRVEPLKRDIVNQRHTKTLVIAESKSIDNVLFEYLSRPKGEYYEKIPAHLKKVKGLSRR